ncbi:MAG: hypothetical protein ACRDFB_06350 [Rhabdochlamydiaceae bacterium]
MSDEVFTYTCKNGHTFESGNKIRAFCPECASNVRRITQTQSAIDASTTRKIAIKQPINRKETTPPVPVKRTPTTKKTVSKPAPKPRPKVPAQTTKSLAAPTANQPLRRKNPGKKAIPTMAKKVTTTTKQKNQNQNVPEPFASRMMRMAGIHR